jgi:hypothetical protein
MRSDDATDLVGYPCVGVVDVGGQPPGQFESPDAGKGRFRWAAARFGHLRMGSRNVGGQRTADTGRRLRKLGSRGSRRAGHPTCGNHAIFHGDPADRMLIATARESEATLVTADKAILQYGSGGYVHVVRAEPGVK